MRKYLVYISLFIGILIFSQNQVSPPPISVENVVQSKRNDNISTDSLLQKGIKTQNEVYAKNITPDFKTKYQGEEYDYSLTKPKKSFGERIQEWVNSIFGDVKPLSTNSEIIRTILRLLGILLSAFLLYFILRFFFDKDRRSIFGKRNKKLNIPREELHENIHEINFPEMILHFESKKDYRSAVRYQFLYLLKKMNAKNLITWNPEKTNRDYETEIKTELQPKYQRWSYIFEYVWYGEFAIDEREYNAFKKEFENAQF